MSLRARLTIAFLLVVLGPVLLGAIFIGVAVDTLAAGRASDQLASAATTVSTKISTVCDGMKSTAGQVGTLYSTGSNVLESVADRTVKSQRATGVRISDGAGHTTLSNGHVPDSPKGALLCGGATPNKSDVVINSLYTHISVHSDKGELLGMVEVWQAVDRDLITDLAAATNEVEVTLNDRRSKPLTSFDSPYKTREAVTAANSSATFEVEPTESSGEYARSVPEDANAPLPIVLSVEAQSVSGLIAVLLAAVVAAAVMTVGVASWLARSTTSPLSSLVSGADAVARGDLSARVPVRGSDEVATLARTFNRMARETQGYVAALTASRDQLRGQLTLLGETLSSTLDLDRILEVIVDTATSVTGARSGVMLLIDPQDPQLLAGRANNSSSEDDTSSRQVELRVGEGMLGKVAAERRARRGRVRGDATKLFAEGEPRCSTYIAVPVTSVSPVDRESTSALPMPGALLGVLAIYDRLGGDDFDDGDLSTLRTFAGQAAVAVGNVLSHREVQRLSLTDSLTGLWNYRYLQVSLAREVERAGRFRRSAALIAVDLDRFKVVNDTYGHPAGDVVLAEVARRITSQIREVDLAFRYGGEEFVILLPESDIAGASVVADRLSREISSEPIVLPTGDQDDPDAVIVTVSMGVAVYPDHGSTGTDVLSAADEALYAAKAAGRDTWQVAG